MAKTKAEERAASAEALRAFIIVELARRPNLSARSLCEIVRIDLTREIPLRSMQRVVSRVRRANPPIFRILTSAYRVAAERSW